MQSIQSIAVENYDIPITQKDFYLHTLMELDTILEQVIGESESSAFVNQVAEKLSSFFLHHYHKEAQQRKFSSEQLAEILIDLKKRIGGQFSVVDITSKKILMRNTRCPFGQAVIGKPSMCHMTSTVFGKVVAHSNGYAGIRIDKAIANGDPHCAIEILLEADPAESDLTREYFSDAS